MSLFRYILTIQMFDYTIVYYANWFNFAVSVQIFLVFIGFWTIACIWNVIFLINTYMFSCYSLLNIILLYFFSIFSGVDKRFVFDDDDDDDDDDNDDDSDEVGDDDNNDDDVDDDDGKDDYNDGRDEEDDADDDD